jgi:hypothetical protein
MNDSNEKTLSFSVDQIAQNAQSAGLVVAPGFVAKAEGSMPSLAADRLYQLAALTAGIFLLATIF